MVIALGCFVQVVIQRYEALYWILKIEEEFYTPREAFHFMKPIPENIHHAVYTLIASKHKRH